MSQASSKETKAQILDVAEGEMAQNGYAGTTLRNIVSKANVNLAAVHYHFGSKEDLFRAVITRIAEPIVSGQLSALAELEANNQEPLSVEEILRAYVAPGFDCTVRKDAHPMRSQFFGRCRTEPEPIQSIAATQFQPGVQKFLDALQRALPDQTRSQLTWKLDLVVSSLIRVLGQAGKPGALITTDSPEDIEQAMTKLISFLIPGIERT
ncbi:MAG: TetR/AcrR family transcriptional regulator [Cyanobacteria bacterium P01_D01_bin.36]